MAYIVSITPGPDEPGVIRAIPTPVIESEPDAQIRVISVATHENGSFLMVTAQLEEPA